MGRRYRIPSGWALAVSAGLALAAGSVASGRSQDPPPPAAPAELPADFTAPPAGPAPAAGAGAAEAPATKGADAPAAKPAGPAIKFPFKLKLPAQGKAAAEPARDAPKTPAAAPPEPAPAEPAPAQPAPPLPEPAPVGAPAAEAPPQPAPANASPNPNPNPNEPPPADKPAPLDPSVEAAQALGTPIANGRPAGAPAPAPAPADPGLPPATAPAGGGAAAPAGTSPDAAPTFIQPAEKFPLGRQTLGLTVDVAAPQVVNLNQTANFKVIVRNSGLTDALGVVVRDELPDGLAFVGSQPEAASHLDRLLTWNLGNVAAGSERVITLTVKATHTGAFDHAASVTMMGGSRSRTIVREPKLKVEQTVASAKVLRGQAATFQVAVTNPGDGPARNVLVQAKLTPGLRYETEERNEQNLLEMTIPLLNPGERVVLDPIAADAVQGGEQSCEVAVTSPDVATPTPEARNRVSVTVIEPKLKMTIAGPSERYTDTLANYELTVENPGTAPARNVRLQATLPVAARLYALPPGATFDRQTRRLIWTRTSVEPGETAKYAFQVRVGGVGQYHVAAEAKGDGGLYDKGTVPTNVTGLADVEFNVTEKRRVVDVNEVTTFVIKVENRGTKEATRVAVSAVLSENLEPVETSGTEQPAGIDPKDPQHQIVFPLIERLGAGKSVELGIRVKVKAASANIGTCRAFLTHDDLSDKQKLDDVAHFKVPPARR